MNKSALEQSRVFEPRGTCNTIGSAPEGNAIGDASECAPGEVGEEAREEGFSEGCNESSGSSGWETVSDSEDDNV